MAGSSPEREKTLPLAAMDRPGIRVSSRKRREGRGEKIFHAPPGTYE
jgi:hypothetical protein